MVMMMIGNVICKTIKPVQFVKTGPNLRQNVMRTYARWVSRRPVAIVNEKELYESEDTTKIDVKPERKIARRPRKKPERSHPLKEEKPQTEKATNVFSKIKETDKIVTSLMLKLRSRKKREKCDEIILEGQRLIKDAVKAGLEPISILFNDPEDIKSLEFSNKVQLYKVPYKTVQLWSSLTTSPGLLGIFKTPETHKIAEPKNALPVTIICDNIREPGNLGSIMRAVAGVGCEKLIIMKGCVDLWHPKVLRSAAGTHFRLPAHYLVSWDDISSIISKDCNVFIADSNFGDAFLPEYSLEELQSSLGIFDINPESLNSNINFDKNKEESMIPMNKKMLQERLLRIPILPYYSVDYTQKESVIIVSGETEGLSFESFKLLSNKNAIRVNIPLAEGVDSLNAGVALGIVVFEIKRQFLKKQSLL